MKTWKRGAALLAALALSLCLMGCGGDQSSDGEWEGGSAPLESTELEAVEDSYEDDWEFEPTEGDWESGPELDSELKSLPSGPPTYTFSDGVLTCSGGGEIKKGGLGNDYGWEDTVANAILETDSRTIDAAVEKVIVEDGITSIGEYAFEACVNLTEVSLPDTLTSIGKDAFHAAGLTSVIIPDSVTYLGVDVFSSCKNLSSATLSNNLTHLPSGTFGSSNFIGSYTSLTSLQIPANVTSFSPHLLNRIDWIDLEDTPLSELIFEGDITLDQIPNTLNPMVNLKTPITVYAHSGTLIETWITQKLPELCAEEGKPCNVTFVAL